MSQIYSNSLIKLINRLILQTSLTYSLLLVAMVLVGESPGESGAVGETGAIGVTDSAGDTDSTYSSTSSSSSTSTYTSSTTTSYSDSL